MKLKSLFRLLLIGLLALSPLQADAGLKAVATPLTGPGGTLPAANASESFGTKLRRLSKQADISNVQINGFLAAPPAWATGTVYYKGYVTSNAGGWYEDTVAGCTSGATAPTGTNGAVLVSDGAGGCSWEYIGGAIAASGVAPTISYTTTVMANAPSWFFYPGYYRFYGCTPVQFAGFLAQPYTLTLNNTPTTAAVHCSVGFMTDAPKFDVCTGNGESSIPTRISVDGQYYSINGFQVSGSANPSCVVLDYSAANQRKTRKVILEYPIQDTAPEFYGAAVDTGSQIWAPPTQDDITAVYISDSISAGSSTYGPFIAGNETAARLGALMGWSDTWNYSIGGTGYVATNSGADYAYGPNRITQAMTLNSGAGPSIWVFEGSTNDEPGTGVQAAALADFQAIRAAGSTAPIVVFGVWSLNGALPVETAVQAAVTQFADPLGKTYFIPIYQDAVNPLAWITGSWNNSADTNSVNSAQYVSADGVHPPDLGTMYLAEREARAIKSQVLPLLP